MIDCFYLFLHYHPFIRNLVHLFILRHDYAYKLMLVSCLSFTIFYIIISSAVHLNFLNVNNYLRSKDVSNMLKTIEWS